MSIAAGGDWDWQRWTERLTGEPGEDFSKVFTHVKVQRITETRVRWAADPRTRAFCDLGLHLLHQHHYEDAAGAGGMQDAKLFRNLGPESLMRHAAVMVPDAEEAARLDRQRWLDTWGHQAAYLEDLTAYLFRLGPSVRRILESQQALVEAAPDLTLGEVVRVGAAGEMASTLADPIVSLQTLIQVALPRHPRISAAIVELETVSLGLWAALYAAVLPAYGLTLREDVTFLDLARMFDTAIEGLLLKARVIDDSLLPTLSNGDEALAGIILNLLPSLCSTTAEVIESATLVTPIVWQPPVVSEESHAHA
jgi:hypothetical protein